MRYLIYHFLLLILVSSCTPDVPNHKLWIRKGNIIDHPDGSRSFARGGRLVLNYKKDSLVFRQFFYDLAEPAYDYVLDPLKLTKRSGQIIAGPTKEKTYFDVSLFSDSIYMVGVKNSSYILSFEPLPTYSQAKHKEAVKQLLLRNTINWIDHDHLDGEYRVEFLNSGRVISQSFQLGDYAVWNLETYNGELFLVFDGFTGGVFHIKGISGSKISSVTYGHYGRQFSWEAKPVVKRFDQSLLPGVWVEDMGEEHEAMYTELVNKDYKTFQPCELFIDSVSVVEIRSSRRDTIYWLGNREGDLIWEGAAYWTIDSLTQEIFVFSQRKSWGDRTRRFVRK